MMNWGAVGCQIPAIKQQPDKEKEHKGYPSMITAVYLMKSPEWRFQFDEDEDDIMDCSDSEGEQSMDEESSDSESSSE